jgi:hypothetical protein
MYFWVPAPGKNFRVAAPFEVTGAVPMLCRSEQRLVTAVSQKMTRPTGSITWPVRTLAVRVVSRPQQPRPQLRGHPGVNSLLDPDGGWRRCGCTGPCPRGRPGPTAPPFVGLSRRRVRSALSAVGRSPFNQCAKTNNPTGAGDRAIHQWMNSRK